MKYYVVGINSRRTEGFSPTVYGDALVYAPDKYAALSMVRKIGWIPNPGGIWLLGTETQRGMTDIVPEDIDEVSKAEAQEKGVSILWTSRE